MRYTKISDTKREGLRRDQRGLGKRFSNEKKQAWRLCEVHFIPYKGPSTRGKKKEKKILVGCGTSYFSPPVCSLVGLRSTTLDRPGRYARLAVEYTYRPSRFAHMRGMQQLLSLLQAEQPVQGGLYFTRSGDIWC